MSPRLHRLVEPLYVGRLRGNGVRVAPGVKLLGCPIVEQHPDSEISIGAGAVLCSVAASTALGVGHPVILRTLAAGARLTIGDDVGISGASICARYSVTIGTSTLIGADVLIMDTDFHAIAPAGRRYGGLPASESSTGVTVGNDVFIGARSVLLKGSSVGDRSVIGAGSIVSGSIPPDVVAAGNPCQPIRDLTAAELS